MGARLLAAMKALATILNIPFARLVRQATMEYIDKMMASPAGQEALRRYRARVQEPVDVLARFAATSGQDANDE